MWHVINEFNSLQQELCWAAEFLFYPISMGCILFPNIESVENGILVMLLCRSVASLERVTALSTDGTATLCVSGHSPLLLELYWVVRATWRRHLCVFLDALYAASIEEEVLLSWHVAKPSICSFVTSLQLCHWCRLKSGSYFSKWAAYINRRRCRHIPSLVMSCILQTYWNLHVYLPWFLFCNPVSSHNIIRDGQTVRLGEAGRIGGW